MEAGRRSRRFRDGPRFIGKVGERLIEAGENKGELLLQDEIAEAMVSVGMIFERLLSEGFLYGPRVRSMAYSGDM